jgi:hypothetical protein
MIIIMKRSSRSQSNNSELSGPGNLSIDHSASYTRNLLAVGVDMKPVSLAILAVVVFFQCWLLLQQHQVALPQGGPALTMPPRSISSIIGQNDPVVALAGSRILVATVAYDLKQFMHFDIMFDSFRDMCESGASVDLVIYTSLEWPRPAIESLEGRAFCRHPSATFRAAIIIKDPAVGLNIVRFHRTLFYENLDKYDLFIFTEDDLHIRPRHAIAYLEETRRLKEKLGDKRLADYSIGFLRYERLDSDNYSHYYFEHFWENGTKFFNHNIRRVEGIEDEVYFTGGRPFHQGMYMATSEQLRAWGVRPGCRFNETTMFEPDYRYIREKISSVHLFDRQQGCKVNQVIPTAHYYDFLIHHMSDKYMHQRNPSWTQARVVDIARRFPKATNVSEPSLGGKIDVIDEREMIDEKPGKARRPFDD